MKDPEEAIEKVLAGLREIDAPAGMERRILQRLEEKEADSGSLWRRLRPMWLVAPMRSMAISVAGAVVVAGVFVVVLTIPAIRRPGAGPAASKKEMLPGEAAPRVSSSTARPSSMVAAKDSALFSPGARARSGIRRKTQGVASVRVIGSDETNGAGDSIAVSEMRAASLPAPPMPLTEQEKLLLRVVHRGDPVEVAMLDPKQRSLKDLKEKAEYQSFFARPAIEQKASGETVPIGDGVEVMQQEEQQNPQQDDNQKSDGSIQRR